MENIERKIIILIVIVGLLVILFGELKQLVVAIKGIFGLIF